MIVNKDQRHIVASSEKRAAGRNFVCDVAVPRSFARPWWKVLRMALNCLS